MGKNIYIRIGVISVVVTASSVVSASSTIVNTDTTWRAIGPVGNLEGSPITSVGLAWEAAHPGWNTFLGFDDTDAAGWTSCVNPLGESHIWVDGDGSTGSTPSYFRKSFELTLGPSPYFLNFAVDDDAFIYVNGQLVLSDTDGVYTDGTINVASFLIDGMNLIAVKAHDSYGIYEFIDLGIVAPDISPIPVPGGLALAAIGASLVGWMRRRGAPSRGHHGI